MLKRILKMLGAQGAGVSLSVVVQVLLPPIFIRSYGVANYGEWLVLSATLSYLSTLNFGITTYASNELTMLHQRGELDQYRRVQASTLAFLLIVICAGVVITGVIALLPLPELLHLLSISRTDAAMIAALIGLQMLCHIFAGYYNNLFMVVQETHRGQIWGSWRSFVPALAAIPFAMYGASFVLVALAQFISVLLTTIAMIVDLKYRMGSLPLGLRGANWVTAKSALAPSGMFAMIFTQQVLLFQVPIIVLQRLLGSEIVVLFTISRTVFSMARRFLSVITNSIAPEITFSFGSGDLPKLLDIFHYSERVVFSLIPVANLGTFLCAPLLIHVWLHKPGLFEPWTYALMALVSGVMSMREHKQFFQFSTNTHHRLAHIVFWGNLLMIAVSIPLTEAFGVRGFMVTWLVSESAQMALLYFENKKLFHSDASITLVPVFKLAAVMGLGLPLCMAVVDFDRRYNWFEQGAIALTGTALLFLLCYWLFGLSLVQQRLLSRLSARRQASVV